ncbi:Glyoxalase/Bleomycin resistance protein/Dihydroxybiphenyl dioxygenase [Mycena maculata]|uniref:Glyoxalase/Bleomycin resistance protein/Dihydroxybiphenyl dioxygenase n=1 Tax=Mycena maculata TaxID=230809 RepID=A0AAD7NMP3_9AGAR|nr:Glyoxalase/Bleomycin resistance protein/Dihydroxybiphenyl dioxygenase [Mycena maculata]
MTSTAPGTPPTLSIHHLKIPTGSLSTKLEFYTTILPFTHLAHFDHRHADSGDLFAVIIQHAPTALLIELRLNPAQAAAQRGWDSITWGVETRQDLETWREWLVSKGVECSTVLKGFRGWSLVAEDPDGAFVKWYCKESHEWDVHVDVDEKWVQF